MMPYRTDNSIRIATPRNRNRGGAATRRPLVGAGVASIIGIAGGTVFLGVWAFQRFHGSPAAFASLLPDGLRHAARSLYSRAMKPAASGDSQRPDASRERAEGPLAIYDAGLAAGWADWSWAERDLSAATPAYQGRPSLTMTPVSYRGVYL